MRKLQEEEREQAMEAERVFVNEVSDAQVADAWTRHSLQEVLLLPCSPEPNFMSSSNARAHGRMAPICLVSLASSPGLPCLGPEVCAASSSPSLSPSEEAWARI